MREVGDSGGKRLLEEKTLFFFFSEGVHCLKLRTLVLRNQILHSVVHSAVLKHFHFTFSDLDTRAYGEIGI